MKRFIKHIIYFGIALWVALFAADGAITYMFHHKVTRKYVVWNDILHTDIDADILIMGNSRAWNHYAPQIIDSTLDVISYNIGIDGSCFNRQKARYDIYRHYQKKKPTCIIQNVGFHTLDYTMGYERAQFMPYMMYPYFRKRICEEEPLSFGELYIPMYRYYMNNFYDEYTKYDFLLYKGYLGEEQPWDGSQLKEMEAYHDIIDSRTLQMFEDYIIETKQEDIKLILVLAPVYNEAINKIANYDEICQVFDLLATQYDIPLLDYTNMDISSDTLYFTNSTHMNKKGAEIFSTKLAHDIDSLGIRK